MTTASDNTSKISETWYEVFTTDERKVLVLLSAYENSRRQLQRGYRAWHTNDKSILQLPAFKQGVTVVRWLEEHGKDITWTDKDWQGYVRYAFKFFAPQVPFVGQLRNEKLFRLYRVNGFKRNVEPIMTREELASRYKIFLRKDLQNEVGLRAMGLIDGRADIPI